jgi:spore coat protein YsxE
MNQADSHTTIGSVLFFYDLYPEKIVEYGRVKKITTNRGEFALKEANITPKQGAWFLHCLARLSELGYTNFVPLCATKYGDYAVNVSSKVYYLMPWLEEDQRFSLEKEVFLIEELGRIHSLTIKEQIYTTEVVADSYTALVNRFEARQLEMERFTEMAERKTYMSPFELNYLTHFHRMMRLAEEAKKRVADWFQLCEKHKRYRSVLCHGRPSRNHVLFNQSGEGYLLNFERSVLDTPARDLAIFFRTASQYTAWDEEETLYWLECYEKSMPLLPEERVLLSSYLCFPEPLFSLIDQYQSNQTEVSQLEYVQKLERRIVTMRKMKSFAERILQPASETHT